MWPLKCHTCIETDYIKNCSFPFSEQYGIGRAIVRDKRNNQESGLTATDVSCFLFV